jgi:P4 family phage/plasmid primase-like protien
VFLKFISDITCKKKDLEEFLLYFLGYSLTGDMREQCYLNFWGSLGANGKTTLLSLVRAVWGGYCTEAPDSIVLKLNGNDGRFDRAALAGARLAVKGDIPEGEALNIHYIKDITGGEPLEAEKKYRDSFVFRPQCKIVLSSNYRLRLPEQGSAMERRVRLMPFLASFKDRPDRDMGAKLTAEAPAVLAILIEYARRWYRDGLPASDVITASSDEYILDEDAVRQFIAERCVRGDGEAVPRAVLYSAFTQWSGAARPPSAKSFKDKMLARGYQCRRETRAGPNRFETCFFGLRLLREGEEKPPEQGELIIQGPSPDGAPGADVPECANVQKIPPILETFPYTRGNEKFPKIPPKIAHLHILRTARGRRTVPDRRKGGIFSLIPPISRGPIQGGKDYTVGAVRQA